MTFDEIYQDVLPGFGGRESISMALGSSSISLSDNILAVSMLLDSSLEDTLGTTVLPTESTLKQNNIKQMN